MPFTTSGQETEWALFLQPQSPHGAHLEEDGNSKIPGTEIRRRNVDCRLQVQVEKDKGKAQETDE